MHKIDALFNQMMEKGGSDLHLEEGYTPKIRLNGHLTDLHPQRLTKTMMVDLLSEICGPEQWQRYGKTGDLDFAYEMGAKSRFRANYFRHADGMGAIFRIIPTKILSLDDLGAPEVFKGFGFLRSGLILVTGPTGSGKSTTMAAVLHHINQNFARRIITIEEPVEFVHQSQKCLISHREVGEDTVSFSSGLKGAMRSDADIVLVGEMRDRETIELALRATEMGVLVFGTLHTNSAAKTIDRVVDVFPQAQKDQIRGLMGSSLQAIVAQQLLRSADGSRRYAVHEILLSTPSLPGVVKAGDAAKLASYIQTGRRIGMQTLDDTLDQMVKEGKVTKEEAYKKAIDKKRFA